MGVDTTSVAVGCAVGIPIGVAVLVAFGCWLQTQRRFKKEDDAEAKDLGIHEDVTTLHAVPRNRQNDINNNEAMYSETSTQSEGETANSASSDKNEASKTRKIAPKYYVPAYKRKLNEKMNGVGACNPSQRNFASKNSRVEDGSVTNSSSASSNTDQVHKDMFEQMVPVLHTTDYTCGQDPSSNIFSTTTTTATINDRDSQDNLIRSLNVQDFGSYPKRRPSANTVNGITSHTNGSYSSFTSRVPSSSTLNMYQRDEGAELHASSRSGREHPRNLQTQQGQEGGDQGQELQRFQNVQHQVQINVQQQQQQDVYILRNNYDLTDSTQIAEEDQYENEFTNYSENKREFIDSLRPKNGPTTAHA